MGLAINHQSCSASQSHPKTHKCFLLCNYALLGLASSCIFLTLSLRLIPSLVGFFFILLHCLTILIAISGCWAASSGSNKRYALHMVVTVLTSIFQGSVSVLIFTATADFLRYLNSYVREQDAMVIMKLTGSLCVMVFFLEWVALVLAFVLKYYAFVEGDNSVRLGSCNDRHAKDEDTKNWPWPFQV